MARRSGLLVPLFSLRSARSWGIGEIGDIAPFARWLESAGQRLLQLLPINETSPGDPSPYSALSAMAIDPQFITIDDLEDFAELGGEAALDEAFRARLDRARAAAAVDYTGVRHLKDVVLRRCFDRFRDSEWSSRGARALSLQAFIEAQQWWLDDYAIFRSLHAVHEREWMYWPDPLRLRQPQAIAEARNELADDVLYRQYLQWVAHQQWAAARRGAGDVALFGDMPFMVGGDSADVWARQDEFRLDGSAGVPPDAFSETGQDWGLPVYGWDVIAAREFDWLRDRARRYADLFDGYRVDHVVGFYRSYFRPHDGSAARFTPEDEPSQRALGERVIDVLRATPAEITAEDLGIVPDFVRESLARLGVPGYKVLRWERRWQETGQPFKDPVEYPGVSVATSGTHDTEPIVVWWENAPPDERAALLAVPSIANRVNAERSNVREVLIESLLASGADLVILPIQDVFGWRDRINQPATVGGTNWTWRLPWTVEELSTEPAAVAAASQLRKWSEQYGRT